LFLSLPNLRIDVGAENINKISLVFADETEPSQVIDINKKGSRQGENT
jgi:hypothetical protein